MPFSRAFGLDSGWLEGQKVLALVGPAISQQTKTLLQGARQRVWVEMYEFQRRDYAQELADLAQQGVEVKVLLDIRTPGSLSIKNFLAHHKVAVRTLAMDDPSQKNHAKLILVDGGIAIVSSMNWGTRSEENIEAGVLLQGSSAGYLENVFCRDWQKSTGQTLLPSPVQAASQGKSRVRVLTDKDFWKPLLETLNSSSSEIKAGLYSFTDRKLEASLSRAAKKGVTVRVVLEPSQMENQKTAEYLAKGHVTVRWYDPGSSKSGVMHLKLGEVDQRLTAVGSANWSSRGFGWNHEISLLIDDPAIARVFSQELDGLWSAGSTVPTSPASGHDKGSRFGVHPKKDYEFNLRSSME